MMQTIALWLVCGLTINKLIEQIIECFDWEVTNTQRILSILGCFFWVFCLWGVASALGVW